MGRLIAAVRAVVALPARATTTLADRRTARAEKREADLAEHVAWVRQMSTPVPYEGRAIRQPRKPKGVAA